MTEEEEGARGGWWGSKEGKEDEDEGAWDSGWCWGWEWEGCGEERKSVKGSERKCWEGRASSSCSEGRGGEISGKGTEEDSNAACEGRLVEPLDPQGTSLSSNFLFRLAILSTQLHSNQHPQGIFIVRLEIWERVSTPTPRLRFNLRDLTNYFGFIHEEGCVNNCHMDGMEMRAVILLFRRPFVLWDWVGIQCLPNQQSLVIVDAAKLMKRLVVEGNKWQQYHTYLR